MEYAAAEECSTPPWSSGPSPRPRCGATSKMLREMALEEQDAHHHEDQDTWRSCPTVRLMEVDEARTNALHWRSALSLPRARA